MDAEAIWELLSGISIGTIIAWVAVISGIISAICAVTVRLYKVFLKYKNLKDKDEWQTKHIKEHDEALKEFSKSLDQIKAALEEQRDLNFKHLRHTIVQVCEDALECGEISMNALRSLEEMFDEYERVFHGNSYVKTLMEKVRLLPIKEEV